MLLSLLGAALLASTPSLPQSSCLSANGKTACGYLCRASVTDVRCASTPYGTCGVFGGEVYCFDPPLAAVHHPPDEGLRPECKAVSGEVACGFRCLIAKGKVACAQTPYGECREHFGDLKCWDPPESSIHEHGAELARPTCLTASTAFACGYDCKSSRAEVRCARTPRGRCVKDDFQLACMDPPALAQCVHSALPDPQEVRKPKSRRRVEPSPEAEPAPRRGQD
jgi:hypothetical protein